MSQCSRWQFYSLKVHKHFSKDMPNWPSGRLTPSRKQKTHKTERATEKIYRQAVADLFDEQRLSQIVESGGSQAVVEAITAVVRMLRRRELYRHISNAVDRIEVAAEALHDIIVNDHVIPVPQCETADHVKQGA